MKKILLLSIAVATLFCACKSNKIKGEDPIIVTGVPEIVDYPGLALGKAVPDWVMAIDEGANKKVSKANIKAMNEIEKKDFEIEVLSPKFEETKEREIKLVDNKRINEMWNQGQP